MKINIKHRQTSSSIIKHHQTSSLNLDLIIPDLKFSFWFWDVLGFRHRENLGEVPEVTVLTPSSPQLLLTEGAYMVLYIIYTYTIYIYIHIYIHHIYIYIPCMVFQKKTPWLPMIAQSFMNQNGWKILLFWFHNFLTFHTKTHHGSCSDAGCLEYLMVFRYSFLEVNRGTKLVLA